jgi:hypothetical protein
MKICPVVLLLVLCASTGAVVKAQTVAADTTLPADTVMVASETMPGGFELFPEVLASSHQALLKGLPMTPAISEGVLNAPVKQDTEPKPLTGKDRLTLFWNETYASPGAFVGVSAGALVDQLRHTPAKWDGDVVCKCQGTLHRSAHALKMTFTTYSKDGRLTLDVPQLASAYGSGMVSTYWYPHNQFSPLVQGVQFGHEQMGEILLGNLVHEFGPDIERSLHLHALTARRHPRPDDDD